MSDQYIARIAAELSLKPQGVKAAVGLLGEDATIPFIARYRKEATGDLDEVAITAIRDRLRAAQGARQAPQGGHPQIPRGAQPPHRRAQGQGRRRRDARHARGHLSALPPEAAHTRHDRQGKGPRTAGATAFRAGRRSPRRLGGRFHQRGERRQDRSEARWPARATSSPSGSTRTRDRPRPDARPLHAPRRFFQSKVVDGEAGRGRQVQGLLRLERAASPRPLRTACWPCAAARARAS